MTTLKKRLHNSKIKTVNQKRNLKKYKTITTVLKSFDTIVIVATTSSSITLSPIGLRLIVIPVSTSIACGLTISNKIIYEIKMQKYNNYKKQYEKDQPTIKSFDKLYR